MSKINYFYVVQEPNKALSKIFSIFSNLCLKNRVLVFIENKKETENLINFLNVFGFDCYGFLNDLEILNNKDSFIYFHDKSQSIDFSKIKFNRVISFFGEDLFEKLRENAENLTEDVDFYDISNRFQYKTVQKNRELGLESTEINFEKSDEKNNFEERYFSFLKEKVKNEFSPKFSDIYFWASSQSQQTLSNILCNIINYLSLTSVDLLSDFSIGRFANDSFKKEEKETKKNYEIILNASNKEILNEEKIRSYLLINSSIKNESILNVYISENKVKIEIESFSAKDVLKYIIENAFEGEFLKIESLATKFLDRRNDFSRNSRGGDRGGRRSFSRDRFSSYGNRDGNRDGGRDRGEGRRFQGNGGAPRRDRFFKPREDRDNDFRRKRDFLEDSSSSSQSFEQPRNSFFNKENSERGGYQKEGFSRGFEKQDKFFGRKKFDRGGGKRFDKGPRDDYEEKPFRKGGFKKGFEF